MSHRIDNKAILCVTESKKCELCGKIAELRPYGPRGENICFDCGMKDLKTTQRKFNSLLLGEDVQ